MLDFVRIVEKDVEKRGVGQSYIEVFPDFQVGQFKDLMVRGGALYAIWDETIGLWCTEVFDAARIIDREVMSHIEQMTPERRAIAKPKLMRNESTMLIHNFHRWTRSLDDRFKQLDQKIVFANDPADREDYASKRLSYAIQEGDISSYKEMMGVLFEPEELQKLEWAVGAVITGAAKTTQKFITLYGPPGTGKSTYIDLLELLFEDYAKPFRARDLGDANRQFALSSFKDSPLVSFEHDGDLSRIQDNSNLNSVVSHDLMEINEKHKSLYRSKINAFLFIGSNKQVKISDAYSGLLRRLIDVHPTGVTHSPEHYDVLKERIGFELGAIAYHCRSVFLQLGKNYYGSYRPTRMMYGTNVLHNFVDQYFFEFRDSEYVTLNQAFDWYRKYMEDANERFPLPKTAFREELRAYFQDFEVRTRRFEGRPRNVFHGFKTSMFESEEEPVEIEVLEPPESITLEETESPVDVELADCPAQYATDSGFPRFKWDEVTTTLKDLDTTKLHYVRPPINHIVIDFDLTDEEGNKSRELNLEAARSWPTTYTEWSKGGAGLHLHYDYAGDPEKLSRVYSPGIEIKVFVGNASLRRKFTACNGVGVAQITSGLPVKEERVIDVKEIKSEVGLRRLVQKNLAKMVHPGTKPSMDFIHKIMHDAYNSGMVYDLTDMKPAVVNFAMNSTNQSIYCLKLVNDIPFKSKEEFSEQESKDKSRKAYFDCEVFPNLFVICWKYEDSDEVVKMVNPTPGEVGALFELNLVGFYNRKYDNHILYARYMGYNNLQLFELSKKLIANERSPFVAAYGISFADIYDFASEKKSLKRWQIELGLRHQELGLPWDQPVPDELVEAVLEYCANDVITTEQVDKARHADFVARQILAELSGLPINSSTNSHSTQIIFGKEKNPQKEFNYEHLSKDFPGYEYSFGKSTYRGMDPSEGGFVFAKPGMYRNVTVYDVASMHPSSILAMDLFGKYTEKFRDIVQARLLIKHNDFSQAKKMLDGKLEKYLQDPSEAKALSNALKIVINSVYGLTSARFENPFRDPRNQDNIVAKRGALFMIDLLLAVQDKGFEVVHIKTDSIKVVDATPELEEFIFEFGKKYQYDFEKEAVYERFCLVNDAVYIGKKIDGKWDAVGAQFKHPYVYKTLFSKEPVEFDDFVEVKTVQTSLWLRFGEDEPRFVGRAGAFVPVLEGGGDLLRQSGDGSYHSASGAKGHKWVEAEIERQSSGGRNDNIDMSYFNNLIEKAIENLSRFGDFYEMVA